MPNNIEYRKLLTDLIQKQIAVLGPSIALLKARNVPSLEVDEDGQVIKITGDPQEALQGLINEYVSLSGEIVKRTMEPLIKKYPALADFGTQVLENSKGDF